MLCGLVEVGRWGRRKSDLEGGGARGLLGRCLYPSGLRVDGGGGGGLGDGSGGGNGGLGDGGGGGGFGDDW